MRYAWVRRQLRGRGLTIADQRIVDYYYSRYTREIELGTALYREQKRAADLEQALKEADARAEGWRMVAEAIASKRAREEFCDGP